MSDDKIRQMTVLFLDLLGQGIEILQICHPAVLVGKVSQRNVLADAFTMTSVVHDDDNAVQSGQDVAEFIISFLVFGHAMEDMNDCLRIIRNINVGKKFQSVNGADELQFLFLYHFYTLSFKVYYTEKTFFVYNVSIITWVKGMKVTGIIVEYNPFHNGHKYHLEKARELTDCDILVAVCSGNFVQRGQPAIIDKWTRRKTAVENGVDLVVELPFPFAVQSAAYFGRHAVDILARAGIDHLVFGSEINNLEELQEIASMSFNIDNFKENMARGYSYPASYGYMADSYGPNDILAISYLRALENYPEITPVSILRTNDYFSEELQGEITSALSIRKALARGQEDISQYTVMADQLKDYPSPSMDKLYPLIRTILLTSSPEELRQIFLMDEGIENHLIKQAEECYSYSEFLNRATTRRLTSSRFMRLIGRRLMPPLHVRRLKSFVKTSLQDSTIFSWLVVETKNARTRL